MAISKKFGDEISRSSSSPSSLNEALLISTMCIIGLQVHVHTQDGSIFSGIFYTISVENHFGIVLKNAKITKKGKSKSNLASGKIVETLVILSSNIVQIVAERVSLPCNDATNIVGDNAVSALLDLPSEPRSFKANTPIKSGGRSTNHRRKSPRLERRLENKVRNLTPVKDQEPRGLSPSFTADAMKESGGRDEVDIAQKKYHPSFLSHQRQAGDCILRCSKQNTDVHQEDDVDARSSSSSLDTSEHVKQEKIILEPSRNGLHEAAERPPSTEISSSHSTALDEKLEMSQGLMTSTDRLPTQAIDLVKKAKEFKLNPGAKIFSPSVTKRSSSTAGGITPFVANMVCVPSNTPMLHVPKAVQPEIGVNPYLSHASSPSKFVLYTNLAAGNAGSRSHFSQHIVGATTNTATGQPPRFTSHYHSVQATPILANPNPQVTVGGSEQLMYMQPISQGLVQGAPHNLHIPYRHLFSPQQLQYQKHQSLVATGQPMQLYAPQAFAATGNQPYAVMLNDSTLMQQPPFPTNWSMQIPVPNVFYGTKFL